MVEPTAPTAMEQTKHKDGSGSIAVVCPEETLSGNKRGRSTCSQDQDKEEEEEASFDTVEEDEEANDDTVEEEEANNDTVHALLEQPNNANEQPRRRPRVAESGCINVDETSNDETTDKIAKLVLKDLASDDGKILKNALKEVASLCSSEQKDKEKFAANTKLFRDFGGQTVLLHVIDRNQNHLKIVEKAIAALCNSICSHTELAVGISVGSYVAEAVLRTMELYPGNYLIQANGIACLTNLCLTKDEKVRSKIGQVIVVKLEGIPLVDTASQKFHDRISLQLYAVKLLRAISQISELRDGIRDGDGLVILARGIKVLKGDKEEWCKKAKETLVLLS